MIKRNIYLDLWKELSKEKPMVFLSGARQVGKTTLAKQISEGFRNKVYFDWDIIEQRKKLILEPNFF
ncbi:MAG: AAA family ATPase, partial [Candidatus Omnitrophota bacterium]